MPKMLPGGSIALLVRTDFSDREVWEAVVTAVLEPTEEDFAAMVQPVDDPAFDGLGVDGLRARIAGYRSFLLVVDAETIRLAEHPVLVVDLNREPGRTFRATPRAIQSVENNLSLANMDFRDFADAVDGDGVFRGF